MRKEFDEVYTNICENGGREFAREYKKNIGLLLKIFLGIIVLSFTMYIIIGINGAGCIVILGGLVLFFSLLKLNEKYLKKYKNEIIFKLVNFYNAKLKYNPNLSIKEYDYIKSKLPERFDEFKSSDVIYGNLSREIDFNMSYVVTYKNAKVDDDENIERIETFKGIFGFCNMSKSIESEIIIDLNDFKRKYNLSRIELESLSFEKKFDCFSNNKIKALQILTPELIEKINELSGIFKNSLQLRIINNRIFFRFSLEEIFIPPKFQSPLNKERLKKLYDAIYFCDNIVECISDSIYENI